MKNRRGITLVSLIAYVVAFSIVVGVITAITLTATSDRKRINTLSSEMYTTNMIR